VALDPTSSRGGAAAAATITAIRFPITFATPGLVPESFPLVSWDVPAQTVTVAGNRTAAFAPGVAFFAILDSEAASPTTVLTSTFAGGNTTIAGAGTFLGDDITYVSAVVAVGATIYTPTVGDMLLGYNDAPFTLVTVSQAWNGATPHLKVLTEAYRQAQSTPFATLDATVADDPFGTSLKLSAPPGFTVGTNWRLWRFTTADPILVQVDDNNNSDPGSTQGAAEIVLLILPAA
jgi:hypothetical protein